MKFSLIAAADDKNGIGKMGKLPWRLKSDLDFFSKVTKGNGRNVVIMGRTTWDSLPKAHRPLKDRINIVLTRNPNIQLPSGVFFASTFDEALKIAESQKPEDIFVVGGANVYDQAIKNNDCEKIYLTRVFGDFDCDAFFPQIDVNRFKKQQSSEVHEENGIKFKFEIYSV